MIFAWLLERCPHCSLVLDAQSRCQAHGWVEAEAEVIFELGAEPDAGDS